MELGELDLLEDFVAGLAPFVGEVEEGGGSAERVCGLAGKAG